MKHFLDGDQLCVTYDNFINLQESPSVFIPLDSEIAQTIISHGFLALPVGDLIGLRHKLTQDLDRIIQRTLDLFASVRCEQCGVENSERLQGEPVAQVMRRACGEALCDECYREHLMSDRSVGIEGCGVCRNEVDRERENVAWEAWD